MSLGDKWSTTAGSDSKLNKVTVISGTGAYLATLTISAHKLVVCTSTGSGFIENHVYVANEAGDAWIDISVVGVHTHADSTDGGTFANILSNNELWCDLKLTKTNDLKKAQWIETVTGTGSIEDATDGTTGERSIRLRPNGTTDSGATISYPHLQIGFVNPALYQTKLRIETATSLALHTGVGADDVTAADSNTRKFQVEVCTTTNNNWWLRTADGSANSASDTGLAITTDRTAIKIKHVPDTPETILYVDDGSNSTSLVKTTDIPVTGASVDINLIKHSIKNSTGADRPMHTYGSRLSYYINDEWI
jgi:hypothetical protein